MKDKVWYRIDLYFYDSKFAVGIYDYGHNDRNIDYERQKAIEQELVVNLLELILTKRNLLFLMLSMKYLGTSNNR